MERALTLVDDMDVNWRIELRMQRATALLGGARSNEAISTMREALALQDSVSGPRDMRTLRIAAKLSAVLQPPESEKILADYFSEDIEKLSTEDPLYGDVLNGLAMLWRKKRNFDLSERYSERAVYYLSKVYGEGSSRVAAVKNSWAITATERGDYGRSLDLLKQSLATLRIVNGDTPDVAKYEHNVGATLMALKRYDESIPFFERAIGIGRKAFSEDSHTLAYFRRQYGWALYALERYDEAEAQLRLALTKFERAKISRNLMFTRGDLACIAVRRDGSMEARQELIAALEYLDKENAEEVHRRFLSKCLLDAQAP